MQNTGRTFAAGVPWRSSYASEGESIGEGRSRRLLDVQAAR